MPDGNQPTNETAELANARELVRRAMAHTSRCRCYSGKRAHERLQEAAREMDGARMPVGPGEAHRARWRALTAVYGRHQLEELVTSASMRHHDKECQDGFCDGGEPVSKCLRHEQTDEVAVCETEIRGLLEERCRELGIDGSTGRQFVVDVLEDLLTQAKGGWF